MMSKQRTFWPRTRLLAMAVLSVSLVQGCGGVGPADPGQVDLTLRQTLDAWQAGEALDSLASKSQPIHVAEPKWKDGFQLLRYEVSPDVKPKGFDLLCSVELWMKDPKGKEVHEKARYIVSAKPERTVVRSL
jgi:hypothetical protein